MTRKLLAIRLRAAIFSATGGKDKNGNTQVISKGKIVLYTIIYALLICSLLSIVFFVAAAFAGIFVSAGAEDVYYGMFILLSFSLLFIISIFETKSELFECKDNELLLSMPISSRSIVVSRICTVLVYNYIIEALIMIPAMISALIFGGSVISVVGALVICLTFPIPATAISSGVGYLVHLASLKFARFKNIVIVALSLGFMAAYFVAYNAIINNFEEILASLEANLGNPGGGLAVLVFLGSVTRFSPIPFLIYMLFGASFSVFAWYVISKSYIKLITQTYGAEKVIYKEKHLVKKSSFYAITRKEFSKFFSSPTYMLNGGVGLIFEIVAAIIIAVKAPALFDVNPEILAEQGIKAADVKSFLSPLIAVGLLFCESMNLMSASALSLEGKSFWIMKSIPIDPKNVLLAKTMPNSVLNVGASVISGLIAAIGIGASIEYYPIFILIPAAGGVLFSLMGIIVNVFVPKFEFVNEAQVVKQSAAAFLSMLANVVAALLIGAVTLFSISLGVLGAYLSLLFILILCLVMYLLIIGPISKRYLSL